MHPIFRNCLIYNLSVKGGGGTPAQLPTMGFLFDPMRVADTSFSRDSSGSPEFDIVLEATQKEMQRRAESCGQK